MKKHLDSPIASEPNPYAPPETLSEARRFAPSGRSGNWLRRLIWLQCAATVTALVCAGYHIETIVFAGPVFGLIGLATAVTAIRYRDTRLVLFGASAPVFALFVFLLIFYTGWGPREADQPVKAISAAYTLAALPFAIWCSWRGRMYDKSHLRESSDLPELPTGMK